MKRLKSNSGSALLWTVMMLGMLMVFCTAVLTISMAYSKRNLNQKQNQQAYFTALSVVDIVANQFSGEHAAGTPQRIIIDKLLENPDRTIEIEDMKLPAELGKVKVTLKTRPRTSGGELVVEDIIITADAEKNGERYRLSGILRGDVTKIDPGPPESDYGGEGTPAIAAGAIGGNNGMKTDPDTDLYIWDSSKDFTLDSNGDAGSAIHMGAVYSNGPVNVNCVKWDSSYTHLHGEIISTKDVHISNTATVGLLPDELLPPGRSECCDNPDTSFIHTTGAVFMDQKSRMGGDITANKINLSGISRVAGNLEADEVNIACNWGGTEDDYTLKGDIKANRVTVSGTSFVEGSITADEVTLLEQSRVEGNIIANKVTLSDGSYLLGNITAKEVVVANEPKKNDGKGSSPSRATVEGNITADKVLLNSYVDNGKVTGTVEVGVLTMTEGAYIEGAVTATTITMTEAAQIRSSVEVNKITMSDRCKIAGTLSYFDPSSKVTGTNNPVLLTEPPRAIAVVEPTKKLAPIASALPPKPAPPPIPPLPPTPEHPKEAIKINDYFPTVYGNDKDSYYVVTDRSLTIANLTVVGDKNIYIFLPKRCNVTLLSMWDDDKYPNVFFILDEGSHLTLNGSNYNQSKDFFLYLWEKPDSKAAVEIKRRSSIHGGIWVTNVKIDTDCGFYWVPPNFAGEPDEPDEPEEPDASGDPSDPDESGDPEQPEEEILINWSLDSYENR